MRLRNIILVLILFIGLSTPSQAAFEYLSADNDSSNLADNAALTFPDADWTLACKFRLVSATYPGDDGRIIAWGTTGANTLTIAFGEATTPGNVGKIYVSAQDADTTTISIDPANSFAADTNDHSFMLIRSSGASGVFTLYIDGSQTGTTTNGSFDSLNNSAALYIGNRSAGSRAANANLTDCAKWDRAFSTAEREGYAAGFSAKCFPNFTWYPPMIRDFNEIKAGIVFTNSGAAVTAHPRMFDCGS